MHQEALTPEGVKIFERLRPSGFVLGGGTGLALQLGHRVSEDFDFFSREEIGRDLLGVLEKNVSGLGFSPHPVVNNKDELTVFAGDIKITFLRYPFPVELPPADIGGTKVFSVQEIAAMKAYALGRRGTLKDYVDLYFIVQGGEQLDSIAALAEKKFGDAFDARLFLEQLVYLDDVEDMPIKFLRERVAKKELQDFFEAQVKKFRL